MGRGAGGRALGLAAVVALTLGFRDGSAQAFVRSMTLGNQPKPFEWQDMTCVPVTIYVNGFDQGMGYTTDKIAKSVAAAAHAWSPDGVTCPGTVDTHPFLEIVPTLSQQTTPPAAAWDAKNSIIFRTDMWTRSGKPPVKAEDNYAFGALAVTTVTARGDGHIVDADIEVNAISKEWVDLDPGVKAGSGDSHDLQNTLTHEFGHFVGLDHTCFNPASGKLWPQDDMMKPVPDCIDAPFPVTETTMFDHADPLETKKRTLADDDKRAVCVIYPSAKDPRICAVDQPYDGCAVAAPGPWRAPRRREVSALALLAVGALAFVSARRRGRRRG